MIRTNYSRRDWLHLFATFAVIHLCLVPVAFTFVFVFYFPAIDYLLLTIQFLSRPDVSGHFWNHLAFSKNIDLDEATALKEVLSAVALMGGSLMLWFTAYIFLITRVMKYAIKLCKKLQIAPMMGLVVFRNNKKLFYAPLKGLK